MALAETAELAVKLTLGGNFMRQMGQVNRSLKTFDRESSRAYRAGQQIGTGIKRGAILAAAGIGAIATQVGFGLDQLIELEALNAQTVAGLKSTEAASGQTAESIRKLAEKYEALNATVDDKVIQSAENVLLTFTNVRKDAFEPALVAALDLSKAFDKDLQSSIIMVGKALNDPVKGLTALGRAGVQFSEEQKKQIEGLAGAGSLLGGIDKAGIKLTDTQRKLIAKLQGTTTASLALEKAGVKLTKEQKKRVNLLAKEIGLEEAQAVVLKEINTQVGGRFAAGAGTVEERVAKFGDAIEDLQKNLASALLPAVSAVADELTKFLQDPATMRAVTDLSKDIAKLFSPANIRAGIGLLRDGFNALKSIAGPIADVIGTAVKAFSAIPPDIQKLLIGGFAVNKLTGGLITNIAGGIFGALKAMTVQAAVVNVTGGIVNSGGIPGIGAAGKGLVGAGAGAALLPVAALAGVGLLMVGAAGVIAEPIRKLLNVTDTGLGSVKAEIAGLELRTGVSQAALVHPKDGKPAPALTDSRDSQRTEAAANRTTNAVEKMKGQLFTEMSLTSGQARIFNADSIPKVVTATDKAKIAIDGAKRATEFGARTGAAATRTGASSVVSAIYANRPITNVAVNVSATSVKQTVTVKNRYGPDSGSRNQDHAPGTGPLI